MRRRLPQQRAADGALGEAGRLRSQRTAERILTVCVSIVLVNLLLLPLPSHEPFVLMAVYFGGFAAFVFTLVGWQRLHLGSRVDFGAAVAPRADRMHALAAALDGGRVDAGQDEATVRGRRGGVEVTARCWTRADLLPAEDALELRLPAARPTPWRATFRGIMTPDPRQPDRKVREVFVHGDRKPPLTLDQRLRLLPFLHALDGALVEVDASGLVLRLPANAASFAPGRAEWCLDQLVDFARALDLPLSDAPALDVTVRPATPARLAGAGHDCPYCRAPVVDDAWRCGECRTEHHRACQAEHGGCTVLGCSGGPDRARARA